nr:hypothetical protein [Tanacetum cinerariifolium]
MRRPHELIADANVTGFKPQKEYRLVPKKPNASSSGNKKKGVEPTIEVSNSNLFDVLYSVDNDMEFGTNGGLLIWLKNPPLKHLVFEEPELGKQELGKLEVRKLGVDKQEREENQEDEFDLTSSEDASWYTLVVVNSGGLRDKFLDVFTINVASVAGQLR